MLATLTAMREGRRPLPPERLRERLQIVQWLQAELAAVERLLSVEHERVRRSAGAMPQAGDARAAALTPIPVGTPTAGGGPGAGGSPAAAVARGTAGTPKGRGTPAAGGAPTAGASPAAVVR